MHRFHLRRAGTAVLIAGGAAAAIATSAGGATSHPAITAAGVGPVKLGATAKALQRKGLIGKLTTGCELAGPGTRAARVKAFRGTVGFTMSNPRKVNVIAVNGRGPRARGVEVGNRLADIKKAYKGVKVDKTLEDTFQGDFVRVPKKSGGRFEFFVSTKTVKIETIGVPSIPVCL
jgi:hypothetical protein